MGILCPLLAALLILFQAMDKNRISYLLHQYVTNKASVEEVEEMFVLLKSVKNDEVLKSFIMEERMRNEPGTSLPQQQWDNVWQAIRSGTAEQGHKSRSNSMLWYKVAAAVVVLFVIGAVIYSLSDQKKTNTPGVAKTIQPKNDIAPGGNKAVLTLADGSTILLDSVQNGLLAHQGNTKIVKLNDGQLEYSGDKKYSGELLFNTISTPRGGQYQMVLPDGSKVWLNAASSIRFPASFSEKERRVELTGEAYFEIAKNPSCPFRVFVNSSSEPVPPGREVGGMNVEVVGTHFNIMAYNNEQSIKTTLLEGKVKVSQDGNIKNLEPGRQAIMDNQTNAITVANANVDMAVAWKNGLFRFKETGIKELMRQVERWYNVEIEYRTQGDEQDYTGIVSRTQHVSSILQMLELTGTVHFQIEGSKIIVLP